MKEKSHTTELRVRGLVVREVLLGETDKLLSVMTAEYGRIPIMAKGARSIKSHFITSAQLMCYSELTFYEREGRRWLREASPIEVFYPIRLDIEGFALAQYFFSICCELFPDGNADGAADMLRLLLNSLYAIMTDLRPQPLIKAAFEFKAMALSGFAPDLDGCAECGAVDSPYMLLDLAGGTLRCEKCVERAIREDINQSLISRTEEERRGAAASFSLSPELLGLLRFIAAAPIKRFLSFEAEGAVAAQLGAVCENYLCNQLERGFETLDFWHSLRLAQSSGGQKEQT